MPHEIETHVDNTGQTHAAAAFARTPAWHKLGTVTADAMTIDDAMTAAHLGKWNIHTVPARTTVQLDDSEVIVENDRERVVVRTNPFTGQLEAMGTVGTWYTPIQNEEHALFLQTLVDEGGANIETAGSLDGGRRVFITMNLASESVRVGGVDPVNMNIACLNSHDGTTAFQTVVTPVRVVCANTERAALANNSGIYKVRHTQSATQQIAEARAALDLTFAYVDEWETEVERMLDTKLTVGQFQVIAKKVIRDPKTAITDRQKRNDAQRLDALTKAFTSPLNDNIKMSRWAGYNAFTAFLDHDAPVNNPGRVDTELLRGARVLTGSSDLDVVKTRAFRAFSVKTPANA